MKHNPREAYARPTASVVRRNNVFSLLKKSPRHEIAVPHVPAVPRFDSVGEMVQQLQPSMPVYCIRPDILQQTAQKFIQTFPGDVLFAVKTNPEPRVLSYLAEAGVMHFDVASIAEVEAAHQANPAARLYFMHPVKSREAIRRAYFEYGVRDFSLDSPQELDKILSVTHYAKDLNLYVRLAMDNADAAYSLAGKFGVALHQSEELLVATREAAAKLGICFHVGSQCMQPNAYGFAIDTVAILVNRAGVKLDILDIGGGFPAIYPGMTPPPLSQYMDVIRRSVQANESLVDCQLICEPGRALVAESGSTIARVELRKGNVLHLNEGTYGSLFDAGYPGFIFPVKAYRAGHNRVEAPLFAEVEAFKLFGPTCDSLDSMAGPFHLPSNIEEGDWIEFGQLGSYGMTMRTNFNGFQSDTIVEVFDKPLLTISEVN